jgi:hypothetical protein
MIVETITGMAIYEIAKVWLPILGVIWSAYKGVNWIKEIRDKDFVNLTSSVSSLNTHITGLRDELKQQTAAFTGAVSMQTTGLRDELKELRSDLRTFYVPSNPRPARAKKEIKPVKSPRKG